jgi:hypothetical protein
VLVEEGQLLGDPVVLPKNRPVQLANARVDLRAKLALADVDLTALVDAELVEPIVVGAV